MARIQTNRRTWQGWRKQFWGIAEPWKRVPGKKREEKSTQIQTWRKTTQSFTKQKGHSLLICTRRNSTSQSVSSKCFDCEFMTGSRRRGRERKIYKKGKWKILPGGITTFDFFFRSYISLKFSSRCEHKTPKIIWTIKIIHEDKNTLRSLAIKPFREP